MIDLAEFYSDFPSILASKVDEISGSPAESLGPLCEEACVFFRSAGIAALLVGFDHDGFNHMLTRSALTRHYLLERSDPAARKTSRFCKISRAAGFFDALAAGRRNIADRIIASSPKGYNPDIEYEDDHAYVRFLYGLLLDASVDAQQRILDDWEAFGGPLGRKRDVCAALLARDAIAFGEAFSALVRWRTQELEAEERSLARDEMAFAGNRYVYVEGLALLSLADMRGITSEHEYRYCPLEARLPPSSPFPDDLYPRPGY